MKATSTEGNATTVDTGTGMVTQPEPAKPTPRGPASPKSMSILAALLLSPFRPAWVATRTTGAPLASAWLGHFIAAVIGAATIVLLAAWTDAGLRGLEGVPDQLRTTLNFVVEEASAHPIAVPATALGVFTLIEAAHVALAFLLMPWGAKDEPLRRTFGHAVRQTWIGTGRFLPAILVVWGIAISLERGRREWVAAYPPSAYPWALIRPPKPAIPENDHGYEEALEAYAAALDEFQAEQTDRIRAWNAWRARRPWYAGDPELTVAPVGFLAGLWILWALLRAVGARRGPAGVDRPRMCTECGYNLHTIPLESRCPECGRRVIDSLGPDAHPGTPWQDRKRIGIVTAWWRSAAGVIRGPEAFGRRLRVSESGADHRRFFSLHLGLIALIAAGSTLSAALMFAPRHDLVDNPSQFVIIAVIVGCLCVAGTIFVACGGALLVGHVQSLRYKRNLLPGAMQVAAYLGGLLAIWAVLGAAVTIGVMWLGETRILYTLARRLGIHSDVLGLSMVLAPNCLAGLVYLNRLIRGTTATRYANR